jgi:hypothetical protein
VLPELPLACQFLKKQNMTYVRNVRSWLGVGVHTWNSNTGETEGKGSRIRWGKKKKKSIRQIMREMPLFLFLSLSTVNLRDTSGP